MFRRIVIANRGEIALRIIRTCRELGIETVIVHSDADAGSQPVLMADEAVNLGDPWCYLDGPRIIEAALERGAEALHPGYGFLAEAAAFARDCENAGIVFIGPQARVMEHLGAKDKARAAATEMHIPCLPGTREPVADIEDAVRRAAQIGYPVLIKAVAGGGGRGMRLARDEDELRAALPRAMSEAETAFKSSAVYLEKYLTGARHIEVQVLADTYGNVVHVGVRDCSVQRRHQKLLEEAPSAAVNDTLQQQMGAAATRLLHSVGYTNAGTVEFLVDDTGEFYFLEVNTRIQVEHPVTEVLYGVDLIAEQLRIAAGHPLSFTQQQLVPRGWAIECRINAEDATAGFVPRPGRIADFAPPAGPGLRVDTAARAGWEIPPFYDSMVAKVIAWAPDRRQALARMRRALSEFTVDGVPTTIPFHLALIDHPDFQAGRINTNFAEQNIATADVERIEKQLTRPRPATTSPGDADTKRIAAISAAVAAVIDRPHRLVAVTPDPVTSSTNRWGSDGRLELMQQRRHMLNPRRDRRNYRA